MEAAAAVPTDDRAVIVLIRSTLASCTSRALVKASASRSTHSREASWARTRRSESSESITTAWSSRLRSLNIRRADAAGRMPLLWARASATTATIAMAATPGATNSATIAVASGQDECDGDGDELADGHPGSAGAFGDDLHDVAPTQLQDERPARRQDRVERVVAQPVDDALLKVRRVDRRGACHQGLDGDDADEQGEQRPRGGPIRRRSCR